MFSYYQTEVTSNNRGRKEAEQEVMQQVDKGQTS